MSRIGADLPLRAVTGIVLALAALASAWAGGFFFLVFWLIAFCAVAFEWQVLPSGSGRVKVVAVSLATMLVVAPLALHDQRLSATAALLVGTGAAGALDRDRPLQAAWSAVGILYAGAPLAAVLMLRGSPTYGLHAVLWLFAVVWGCDVLAYFGGRLIGGPKLWPAVSPGKTWSGLLTGVFGGAVLGVAAAGFSDPVRMFEIGFVAALIAQGGDLFESALKRRFGVKDSSGLIPGHGGFMDRLDGFITAAVVVAFYAWSRTGGDWIAAGLFEP